MLIKNTIILSFVLFFTSISDASETFISLEYTLQRLSSAELAGRQPGTDGHQQAKDYIYGIFDNESSQVNLFQHQFSYQKNLTTKHGTNYIYLKLGREKPQQFIAITAHYDHLGKQGSKVYYGADDNASGTAMLLALQQYFINRNTKYSILFIATDAEEDDLAGSNALLKSQYILDKNIILNVNLDMIAHGYRQKYLYVNKTTSQKGLENIITKYNNITSNTMLKTKRYISLDRSSITRTRIDLSKASDHYEFAKIGIPYLFITGENHKFYHSTKDTFESINIQFYRRVFESMKSLILLIDNEF